MKYTSPIHIKQETVKRLIASQIRERKVKISSSGAALAAEFLACFVREAVNRSAKLAKTERKQHQDDDDAFDSEPLRVEVEHLEKILPALLTDF